MVWHFVETPEVTHVIHKGSAVGAVTSLGDDVFVVRSNSQQIEVYDAATLTLQRYLAVPWFTLVGFSSVC